MSVSYVCFMGLLRELTSSILFLRPLLSLVFHETFMLTIALHCAQFWVVGKIGSVNRKKIMQLSMISGLGKWVAFACGHISTRLRTVPVRISLQPHQCEKKNVGITLTLRRSSIFVRPESHRWDHLASPHSRFPELRTWFSGYCRPSLLVLYVDSTLPSQSRTLALC